MKHLFIHPGNSIKEALKQLCKGGEKCLLVIQDDKKLLGTLSDGDVRNAILNGINLNENIDGIFNNNPTIFHDKKFTEAEAIALFIENKFDVIPVLNSYGKVVDILTWADTFKSDVDQIVQKLKVPVVIMAGGRGSRMEPFTKVLPKPLVPVHDKPIIEHIIERFTKAGCNEFYLTTNYKGLILKAFFEELQPDYEVHFLEEQEPMGTAGSLRFLDGKFRKPFFVTNCDIIIRADYDSFYKFHQKGGYDISLVASAKEYIIPYGTCELNEDGHLSHINEKPHYDFLINTGLYILTPEVLKLIPENKFYHITHLIEEAKNLGKKVGVFPIDDDAWIDVGQWAEYRQALEKF